MKDPIITAIDTSVLLVILRKEPGWELWIETLADAAKDGPLVICPVAAEEISIYFERPYRSLDFFAALGIQLDDFDPMVFQTAYRNALRQNCPHLLPYKLITTHSFFQANRLALETNIAPDHFHGPAIILYRKNAATTAKPKIAKP